MKPLNKAERWYTFLEIIYVGRKGILTNVPSHVNFGFLSETGVHHSRTIELDDYVELLWKNPPKVVE